MSETKNISGYKVFNPDWTCRGYQYEVGKTFEEDVKPMVCDRGFHFCEKAADCFDYYSFDLNNKVAEVVALGAVDSDSKKSCTDKIHILREVSWQELLEIVNTGKGCTGLCNSGNRNSGNCNSGNRNSGNCNSGNRNSGNRNSGDWNKCNFSAGVFCTETPKLLMFNKPTEMTFEEWRRSEACRLLNRIDFRPTVWVWSDEMTDEEKASHPEYETCEGYLKQLDLSECCHDWWMNLTMNEKCVIQNMPNFDPDIFFEITGIRV